MLSGVAIVFAKGKLATLGFRMLGLLSITWGLFSGFFGLAMVVIWRFSCMFTASIVLACGVLAIRFYLDLVRLALA